MYDVRLKRVARDGVDISVGVVTDLMSAYELRNRKAAELIAKGFRGGRNSAGVWRLSKYERGRRVRVSVYVAHLPVCLN
jgi:hypothetical protein